MSDSRKPSRITAWLEAAHPAVFVLYAVVASFSTYFCMYAFRRPFTVGLYEGDSLGSIKLLTIFNISQLVGYALSKFIGVKVCSEVTRDRRAGLLVALILWAEAALVLLALMPPAFGAIAMFLNGLPLGMIWGLVVWYLEGRRTSELLLAGLSCSFIVSSAAVKDVGRHLMAAYQVSEWWMPAATGLCFLPLFFLSVWFLNQIPHPDAADVEARVRREPMGALDRRSFVRTFLPGLVLLLLVYFFLTAYRDFRDTYQFDIVRSLGYSADKASLTKTETLVAFGVLVPLACLVLVKDNRRGLMGSYAIMVAGVALLGLSTILFEAGGIDGFWWMTLVGLGCYLAYVPYGSVFFDRLIASTRFGGTAVFAIYMADAIGYTGSIGVQLYKDFARKDLSRLEFFRGFTYFMSALGVALLVASGPYFLRRRGPEGTKSQHDSIA